MAKIPLLRLAKGQRRETIGACLSDSRTPHDAAGERADLLPEAARFAV